MLTGARRGRAWPWPLGISTQATLSCTLLLPTASNKTKEKCLRDLRRRRAVPADLKNEDRGAQRNGLIG